MGNHKWEVRGGEETMSDEQVGTIVYILLVTFLLIFVVEFFLIRACYRIDCVEDSRCTDGYVNVLVEDKDGARKWAATEATCGGKP
jgi:hypothetical protein